MYRRTEAESRILILTPRGRDAQLIATTLSSGALVPAVCPDYPTFRRMLNEGAAAAVVAEEALGPPVLAELSEWLRSQPPWSDFPFVALISGGRPSPATVQRAHELEALGNVTFLERPVRPDYRARIFTRGLARTAAPIRDAASPGGWRRSKCGFKDEVAHVITSHDLREPIRNIAIYSEIIADTYEHTLNQEGRDLIKEHIKSSGASRMGMLVNDTA